MAIVATQLHVWDSTPAVCQWARATITSGPEFEKIQILKIMGEQIIGLHCCCLKVFLCRNKQWGDKYSYTLLMRGILVIGV